MPAFQVAITAQYNHLSDWILPRHFYLPTSGWNLSHCLPHCLSHSNHCEINNYKSLFSSLSVWSHCSSFCMSSAGSNNRTVWANAAKSPWDGMTSKVRVDTSADVQFTISWGDFPCLAAVTWNTFFDKSSCWCINYMSWKRSYRCMNKYAVTFTLADEKLPLCSYLMF